VSKKPLTAAPIQWPAEPGFRKRSQNRSHAATPKAVRIFRPLRLYGLSQRVRALCRRISVICRQRLLEPEDFGLVAIILLTIPIDGRKEGRLNS